MIEKFCGKSASFISAALEAEVKEHEARRQRPGYEIVVLLRITRQMCQYASNKNDWRDQSEHTLVSGNLQGLPEYLVWKNQAGEMYNVTA